MNVRCISEGKHVLVQFEDGMQSFVVKLEGRYAIEVGEALIMKGRQTTGAGFGIPQIIETGRRH